MERTKLETAGRDYWNLRGLYSVPAGLLFVAAGLANLGLGPIAQTSVFAAAVVAAVAAAFAISRYYGRTYGRVEPAGRDKLRASLATVAGALVIAAGVQGDWSLDLPLDLTAASFAVVMLGYYAVTIGLRPHHLAIWGALLVAGLVPAWGSVGSDSKINVGLMLMGIASIAAGLLDHVALRRSLGPAVESGHA